MIVAASDKRIGDRTWAGGLERMRADRDQVRIMRNHTYEIWARLERARFQAVGGCMRCAGRGTIVRTMYNNASERDRMFSRCPEGDCTPESRARTGLDLSYESAYDPNRGLYISNLRAMDPLYRTFVKMYDDILRDIKRQLSEYVR